MINLPVKYFDNYMLREVLESDVEDYFIIGKDIEVAKYLSFYPFMHFHEAVIHFNNLYFSDLYKDDPKGYAIVDLNTNKMIGIIDFHTYNKTLKTANIGYLLNRNYWNLGIITKALSVIVEVGFEVLNLKRIYVKTVKENYSSRRVCEKNNFHLLSIKKKSHYHHKTNTYHDLYKYVIERKTYNDSKTKRNL